MSEQGVKHVIAALISDPVFNNAFFKSKRKTLNKCGYQLTAADKRILMRLNKQDVKIRVVYGKRSRIFPPKILPPPPGQRVVKRTKRSQ